METVGKRFEQGEYFLPHLMMAGEIACTEAAREGITAFLEKRRPEFKK